MRFCLKTNKNQHFGGVGEQLCTGTSERKRQLDSRVRQCSSHSSTALCVGEHVCEGEGSVTRRRLLNLHAINPLNILTLMRNRLGDPTPIRGAAGIEESFPSGGGVVTLVDSPIPVCMHTALTGHTEL